MKVVSEQLRHNSFAITADTYTRVLTAVAQAAAEAVAGIVPRTRWCTDDAPAAGGAPGPEASTNKINTPGLTGVIFPGVRGIQ